VIIEWDGADGEKVTYIKVRATKVYTNKCTSNSQQYSNKTINQSVNQADLLRSLSVSLSVYVSTGCG